MGLLISAKRAEKSPEEVASDYEKTINSMLEESGTFSVKKDYLQALERAKEAEKKERDLFHHREKSHLTDQMNVDLTFAVVFNVAVQHELAGQFEEAMKKYQSLAKDKQFVMPSRIRINMGNIFFRMKKYTQSMRMYQMALDDVPKTHNVLRMRIMRNIGNVQMRMGQFQDALQTYETIMEAVPDTQSGLNLIVCCYAIGDSVKMKRALARMLAIDLPGKGASLTSEDGEVSLTASGQGSLLTGRSDPLRDEIRERERLIVRRLLRGAKLMAPRIEPKWEDGFAYVIEQLKTFGLDARYHVSGEMEMSRALMYLRNQEFDKAIESLKAFEKRDEHFRANAATNLSYVYFLEGDLSNAESYAKMASSADRYSARALVNEGNCAFARQRFEEARQLYLDAIQVEADCVEAIFNYALTCKRMSKYEEALRAFRKLLSILTESPEVVYHIADLSALLGDVDHAIEWMNRLLSRVRTDVRSLIRLGSLCLKKGDESQAFHYYSEAYRYFPADLSVIQWLGAYYVKSDMYEKAVGFFERAAEIEPHEVKWRLMVASCYRRVGSFLRAKELYEAIHKEKPQNVECLRYLAHVCNELGMRDDAERYLEELSQVEPLPPAASAAATSSSSSSSSSSVASSASDGGGKTSGKSAAAPSSDSDRSTSEGKAARVAADGGGSAAAAAEGGRRPSSKKSSKQEAAGDVEEYWGDADVQKDLLPM